MNNITLRYDSTCAYLWKYGMVLFVVDACYTSVYFCKTIYLTPKEATKHIHIVNVYNVCFIVNSF